MNAVAVTFANQADGQRYLTWCNANNPDKTPGAVWYQPGRLDKNGNMVVAYLGPGGGWDDDFAEPAGGEAARAGGVLVQKVEWAES